MNAEDIRATAALLRNRNPRQGLAPNKPWNNEISERIAAADLGNSPDALALKAGLLLWNDDLDRSHSISQAVDTETGSYWHGIMHRMEGDYGNAKYWFRHVGSHPAFTVLAAKATDRVNAYANVSDGRSSGRGSQEAALLAGIVRDGAWNPYAFIDCVERGVKKHIEGPSLSPYIDVLERIQHDEIEILLSYCFHQVFGGTLFEHNER